jgi:hypothetical protein
MSFLNPETKFPRTPSLDKAMTQWYESPSTTAIFDFEYNPKCLIHMKEGESCVSNLEARGWEMLEPKYNNFPLDSGAQAKLALAWYRWQASIEILWVIK